MYDLFPRYKRLCDMIAAKADDPSTTSVLELGCASGKFVDWFRLQGYDAEGVDGSETAIERGNKPYLHHGEHTALENVFGEQTFKIMVAQGVFSMLALAEYLYISDRLVQTPEPGGRLKKGDSDALAMMEQDLHHTLVSTYAQLEPGGFLLIRENDGRKSNSIYFSQEKAESIGFVVEHYETHEAILKKPLSTPD